MSIRTICRFVGWVTDGAGVVPEMRIALSGIHLQRLGLTQKDGSRSSPAYAARNRDDGSEIGGFDGLLR